MADQIDYFRQTSSRLLAAMSSAWAAFKRRKFLWLLILAVTFLYSSLSVLRHRHFKSSAYDLGIFDQVIWKYSQFQAPYSTVRSNLLTENLLGDHFHPVLALLSPLYWFTDGAEALLVAQAVLFAVAILPLFLFTEKRLGKFAAYLFAVSYSIFWGIQKAVEFDFHEIAFAVPLIAFAIYFIDEERWAAYFACLALLLLTKENLSVLVFFFGLYLVAIRQFRRGLVSMGAGVVWFFVSVKGLIPLFIGPAAARGELRYFRYWNYSQFGSTPSDALVAIVKDPLLLIRTLFSPGVKLHAYWHIFHPFLFLPFFSPLFILAVPLIAERFLSDVAPYWGTDFHYTAVLVPVLVTASVDGLARIARRVKKVRPHYLIIPASVLALALNLYTLPRSPLWDLTSAQYWRLSQSDRTGRKAVSLIPPAASVAAQGAIAPHLSQRHVIYVLHPHLFIPDADFIIASEQINPFPSQSFQDIKRYLDAQQVRGYRRIFDEQGWVVLKREAAAEAPSPAINDAAFVEQSVPDSMTAGRAYDVHVTMRNTGIKPWTADEFYRLAYLGGTRDWVLERAELPSTVEPGSVVKFSFKVTAPSKPGTYSFHWGMIQDGAAAFGERTPQVWVTVAAARPTPE